MMGENNGAGTTPVTHYGTGPGGLNSSTILDRYVDSTQPGNATGKGAAEFCEYLIARYLPGGAGSPGGVGYPLTRVIVDQELRGRFSAAAGLDFWANDGSQFQSTSNPTQSVPDMIPTAAWPAGTPGTRVHFDGSVVLDDREKAELFGNYVERYFPRVERVWAETYPSSNNDPAEAALVYASWVAGGYDIVHLWTGPKTCLSLARAKQQGVGVALWKPAGAAPSAADAVTPLGLWAQSITAITG